MLAGECVAILEGEERRLRAWDFVHCPPGTHHVFVGAGDGPCAILMLGARPNRGIDYPRSELALGTTPASRTRRSRRPTPTRRTGILAAGPAGGRTLGRAAVGG